MTSIFFSVVAMWLLSNVIENFLTLNISHYLMNLTFNYIFIIFNWSDDISMIEILSNIEFFFVCCFFLIVIFSRGFNGKRSLFLNVSYFEAFVNWTHASFSEPVG
jgi:hypothetical protein